MPDVYYNIGNAADQCDCGSARRPIAMHTTDETDPSGYPVMVYDVNLNPVAVAYGKDQYISIWNATPVNAAVGTLYGAFGLFVFLFIRRTGTIPGFVYGNPLNQSFGTTHRNIITDDGQVITDDSGQPLTTD